MSYNSSGYATISLPISFSTKYVATSSALGPYNGEAIYAEIIESFTVSSIKFYQRWNGKSGHVISIGI